MIKKIKGDELKLLKMQMGPLGPFAKMIKDSHPELFEQLAVAQKKYENSLPSKGRTTYSYGTDNTNTPPKAPTAEEIAYRAQEKKRAKDSDIHDLVKKSGCGFRDDA